MITGRTDKDFWFRIRFFAHGILKLMITHLKYKGRKREERNLFKIFGVNDTRLTSKS